jgi:hypothetical protein
MAFSKSIKEKALVNSRRCCCICHEFAGLYTNVHHIKPKAKKGPDTLENAIVLCLKCHGEVGHYNENHPIGNKYSRKELIQHRDRWWRWCRDNPYSPLPSSPIVVSPNEIFLSSGEWATVEQINLFNKTDSFLYQLWLKIIVKSKNVKAKDIEISFNQKLDNSNLKFGKVEIDLQIYQVYGTDSNNEEVFYLVVEKMKPKTSYQINLIINSKIDANHGDFILLYLASFSTYPSTKSEKKDVSGSRFSLFPPENLKLESVSLLMKRDEE